MEKKRIRISFIFLVLLSTLFVSLPEISAVTLTDSTEDVLYIVDLAFNSIGDYHREIDIVSLEITHGWVVMYLNETPTTVSNRKYVVDICWDDVVSTRADMAGKNNTHCVYSYNENYAITRTYKPDGSEYGTGTAPNSGEVGTNKITWYIDSFDIRDPFNPKTVFADTHYSLYLGGQPPPGPREDWKDYYPDDSHTYNTKKFGLENYSIFLLAIPIIVLLHHRKKQKK